MEIKEAINKRRSVREFAAENISEESLLAVLEAGRWAPSGQNNQPWSLVIVRQAAVKEKLAGFTKYGRIIKEAPVSLVVFYNQQEGYDQTKDTLAIGAFIQNMLLAAHSLGLGACWLGEILKEAAEVKELLAVPATYQLMAVVALGKPVAKTRKSTRKPLEKILYKVLD